MDIIARSRIGYWTAFRQDGVSYLNIRASDTDCATIVLTSRDVELLGASADVCHPHARHLAEHGKRLNEALPTPPRGNDEPEPHEWQPRDSGGSVVRLKAA